MLNIVKLPDGTWNPFLGLCEDISGHRGGSPQESVAPEKRSWHNPLVISDIWLEILL